MKVCCPTEEINNAVQKKLRGRGYYPLRILTLTDGSRIVCTDWISTSNNNYKQVHYLQVLTWNFEGQLFRYHSSDLTFYQVGDKAYWWERGELKSNEYSLDPKRPCITLVDVNENKIEEVKPMNNEMPELEAGKHVLVTENGEKYLLLTDGICIEVTGDYWSNARVIRWINLSAILYRVTRIYSITNYNGKADINCGSKYCPLIWQKEDDKKVALRKQREEVKNKMEDLQKELEKIEEML